LRSFVFKGGDLRSILCGTVYLNKKQVLFGVIMKYIYTFITTCTPSKADFKISPEYILVMASLSI
jgi:hypothetical protein